MAKIEISKARYKSLLAAEAFCQAARDSISNTGYIINAMPHFDAWMRHTPGGIKYLLPKKPYPVWCCNCKKRHIFGECRNKH